MPNATRRFKTVFQRSLPQRLAGGFAWGFAWSFVLTLPGCGSHRAEDALPDAPPSSDSRGSSDGEKKTDTPPSQSSNDLSNRLRTEDALPGSTANGMGQEEGICGTPLSLDIDSKNRTTARYVLRGRASPDCADGNDVLVSLGAAAPIRTLAGSPCEPSATPEYTLVCRVPGSALSAAGEIMVPVLVDGAEIPPGGSGESRMDVRFLPKTRAYAEFVPADF